MGVSINEAQIGDVVILSRGLDPDAGHVGLYAGRGGLGLTVFLLGGNQTNGVTVAEFPVSRVLGIRRITE
jgi:cell wall-associated NlpC family hydrolase